MAKKSHTTCLYMLGTAGRSQATRTDASAFVYGEDDGPQNHPYIHTAPITSASEEPDTWFHAFPADGTRKAPDRESLCLFLVGSNADMGQMETVWSQVPAHVRCSARHSHAPSIFKIMNFSKFELLMVTPSGPLSLHTFACTGMVLLVQGLAEFGIRPRPYPPTQAFFFGRCPKRIKRHL